MCYISILTNDQNLGQQIVVWTKNFCAKQGLFPMVEQYEDSEDFYNILKKSKPSNVIVALAGVAGLNASEHIRSLCPDCGLIWCSDLDFSLHAYHLRAEYFIKIPLTNEELCEGLSLLMKRWQLWHNKAKAELNNGMDVRIIKY